MAEVIIDVVGNDQASGALGGIGASFANLGSIVSGIRDAFDLVSGAIKGVVDFGAQFVNSAMDSEAAVADLEATLKSTGGAAGMTSQELQDLANGFQNTTKFSDEAVLSGEAMLLTFTNIGKDVFPMATEAMLNLGEKFGSIDSAAVQLGKALNDPVAGITALTRVGVSFTEQQKEQIKVMVEAGDTVGAQKIILAELEKEFGGLAEAMGDTFAGKWEIFKNNLDTVKETIGAALLPLLSSVVDKFMEWLPVLQEFGNRVANVFSEIADAGLGSSEFNQAMGSLDSFVTNLLQGFADAVNNWVNSGGPEALSQAIVDWLNSLGTGTGFQSGIFAAVGNILAALGDALSQVDWSGIIAAMDDALARMIDNHDWTASGASFGEMIGKLLSGNIEFDAGTSDNIVSSIASAVSDWFLAAAGVADWAAFGQFWKDAARYVGTSIVDGIIAGVKWAWGNLIDILSFGFDDVVDLVKGWLGIASPSSVFFDIGVNLIQGLINGVQSMWKNVTTFFAGLLDAILAPFQPLLDALGIDLGTGATGEVGGRPMGDTTPTGPAPLGGTPTSGVVNNYYYGPVYFGAAGEPGAYYECPSPHPLMTASSKSLLTSGIG